VRTLIRAARPFARFFIFLLFPYWSCLIYTVPVFYIGKFNALHESPFLPFLYQRTGKPRTEILLQSCIVGLRYFLNRWLPYTVSIYDFLYSLNTVPCFGVPYRTVPAYRMCNGALFINRNRYFIAKLYLY